MSSWLLFGHLVGVVLVVGASLAQVLGASVMRRATTVVELRTLQRVVAPSAPLGGIGMLLLLATGLTMAARDWSFTDGWISTSIGLLAAAIITSLLLVTPRSRRLREALGDPAPAGAAPAGAAPAEVTDAARDRVLHVTQLVLLVVQFEIVALMVLKPAGGGILASLLAAAVVAATISLPVVTSRSGQPARPRPAAR
jgi:Predicted integral membrane protein (DUF2269)